MEINSTVDQNKCWGLFPSWGPGVLSQPPHHTDCPYLETFIRRTVPCPPPTNPCLFWAAANNSKLSSEDIQLVTSACDIPSFSECSHYPPLNPSIFVEGICTPGCLGGVVSFLILSLLAVSLVVVFSLKRRERSLREQCCSGVCICVDRVVIKKTGLNRSESRTPALVDSGTKPEKDFTGDINDGYVHGEQVVLDIPKEAVVYSNKPDDKDLDSGIVPNVELKLDESVDEGCDVNEGDCPAPDAVNIDPHTQNRLSHC